MRLGRRGRGKVKRWKRRARSEDPGEPQPPPDGATGEAEEATGDEPTLRDRIREMEWRHATGVEDLETGTDEARVVRGDDEGVVGPDKEVSRRTAEEVSSSGSDEADVEEMSTEDEEELWRRVERDGFPREDTELGERPDGFPREEDIDTTPGVWATPPQPRRDMGGRIIPQGEIEFRRHLRDRGVAETREAGSDETEVM